MTPRDLIEDAAAVIGLFGMLYAMLCIGAVLA